MNNELTKFDVRKIAHMLGDDRGSIKFAKKLHRCSDWTRELHRSPETTMPDAV